MDAIGPVHSRTASDDLSELHRRQAEEAARIVNNSNSLNANEKVSVRVDDRTHRLIVEIVDRANGQVIEQIPKASLFQLVNQRRRV